TDEPIAVPQPRQHVRAPADRVAPVAIQGRLIPAQDPSAAIQELRRQRNDMDRQPQVTLIPGLSLLIGAESPVDHPRLVQLEPESEAVEAQPPAAELDGLPAKLVTGGESGQHQADVVQLREMAGEPASGGPFLMGS